MAPKQTRSKRIRPFNPWFIDPHSVDEPLQLAFKKGHSTETAMVKAKNVILLRVDELQVVLMVLLDFSAAFDTYDLRIHLSRLETQFIYPKVHFHG